MLPTRASLNARFSEAKSFFTGQRFYVCNAAAAVGPNGVGGSDASGANHGQDPDHPFASIDFAVGQCVAGRGDVIYAMIGHNEAVSTAGGLALDVADVTLVGLGTGSNQAKITFTGTTDTADVNVDAANVTVEDMTLDFSGNDELDAAWDVNAAGHTLRRCRVVLGASTTSQVNTAIICDANADQLLIEDCVFVGTDTAATTAQIAIVLNGQDEVTIRRCTFRSSFGAAVGAIDFQAVACTNVLLQDLYIHNTLATSSACIDCSSLANEGLFQRLILRVDDNASVAPIAGMTNSLLTLMDVFVINDNGERGLVVGTASA